MGVFEATKSENRIPDQLFFAPLRLRDFALKTPPLRLRRLSNQ